MKKIKVSVIIPFFNVENYFKECLDSIVNQTLKEIEIICVNDGSTDGSSNILKKYMKSDERICIINQSNHGQGYARNVALSQVKGDYVYFMDADDYLELTALEELYNIAESKSLDLVIFKLINFHDGTRETFQTHYYEMNFLKDMVGSNVFNYNNVKNRVFEIAVSPPGKLFKSSIISDVRFPENLIFEDNPFFVEAFLKSKRVYFHNKHLYYRRIRDDSTTTNFDRYSDAIIILNKIIEVVKKLGLFQEFATALYFRKINQTLFRYNLLDEEFKRNFFIKMKEDFSFHQDDYESDEAFKKIQPRLRNVFYSCLASESYKEFDLRLSIFNYKNEISSLKQINNEISKKSHDLEAQCIDLKNNNSILSDKLSDFEVRCIDLKNNNSILSDKLSDFERQCMNLKDENDFLSYENLKLKDSNNYLKNENYNLLIEKNKRKYKKNYKSYAKYSNIKKRLF